MWMAGGLVTAAGTAGVAWLLVRLGAQNLPQATGRIALYVLLGVALLIGFLAGAAICRRAARDSSHLGLFSALACGTAGGVVGATYAVTLTAAYLHSFTTWPQDSLDQVLVLLSYPVFAGLGMCLGGLVGLVFGFLVGGILKLFAPRRLATNG